MPNLRLKTLTCYETEDSWGSDDAYIIVNGELAWGPIKINDNQSRTINKNVGFSAKAIIELWDKDDLDPDDRLGTQHAHANQIGQGEKTAYFNGDDSNYRLIFEVV